MANVTTDVWAVLRVYPQQIMAIFDNEKAAKDDVESRPEGNYKIERWMVRHAG
jgi:hypothetical protein